MIRSHFPPSNEHLSSPDDQYDVIVMGGGPAGATVGALLADAGHAVLILERSIVPRFHVGESLLPESYWPLKRLGLIEQLKQSAFPKKFSVQFVTKGWKESAPYYFDEHIAHESAQTWQVERADFDKMLLDNAVAKGATLRVQAHVLDVLFEGDRAVGVKVKLGNQRSEAGTAGNADVRHIRSRVVCDASGVSAFLSTRLGLKQPDPLLQKGTIWTYFRGALRDPGKDEGATIVLQTEGHRSWFWYIPLRNDIVSIGCTGSMPEMFPPRSTPAEVYAREVERCPALQRRLENAARCMDYFTTKDYSYRSSAAAGPGWVLVGDAYGFIDPVYSSGVLLALKAGEFAADAVLRALATNDLSGETLSCWKETYDAGVYNFRRLVYAFYTPEFSFGQFLRTYPQYRKNIVDILSGAVFKSGVSEIFDAMGNVLPPSDRRDNS
jgi:flavin-dependent dehydrogenase